MCNLPGRVTCMPVATASNLVREWHANVTAANQKPLFAEIGRLLYRHAVDSSEMLMTVQVGGMDGSSNDPMYKMFVSDPNPIGPLTHWLPIVVEPVPTNFEALTKTYDTIHRNHGLPCPILLNSAVAYDGSTSCTFCHFNTSDNALPNCKSHPPWMQLQLGTLDCDYSRRFFNVNFDTCIIQRKLECGPIRSLVEDRNLPLSIAMLQVDVEGYESTLIPGLLQELADHELPSVIHFENKVLRKYDKKNGTTHRLEDVKGNLEEHGYLLYDQGEDTLAVKVR